MVYSRLVITDTLKTALTVKSEVAFKDYAKSNQV